MKQRNSNILVVLFTMLLPCAAWADLKVDDTFETDGITYHVTSTNPLEVSVGNGDGTAIDKETTGAIVIPDDVTGPDNNKYSVTNIAPSSFSGCKGLTAVTIGNSIKKIQYKAFYDCSNLTTFNIPASVTDIGLHAFEKTAWYTNLPDGLIYKDNVLFGYKGKKPEGDLKIVDGTRVIAYSAIFDCDITSVSIPNSMMFIGQQAFQGCYLLKSVTIPNSVKSIGFRAFAESGLTEIHSLMKEPCKLEDEAFRYQYIDAETYYSRVTLLVPAGTKALYEAADGWKEFKNIVEMEPEAKELAVGDTFEADGINYTVYRINPLEVQVGKYGGNLAVDENTEGDITIPASVEGPDENTYSVTSIRPYAFEGCKRITSVSFPNTIREIGDEAFARCTGLISVNIPNSVTIIEFGAFYHCENLTSIMIPNSVTKIGHRAFLGCSALVEVYSQIEEPFEIGYGREDYDGINLVTNSFEYEIATLYVPTGTKAKYEATKGWKEFKTIVEKESESGVLKVNDAFTVDGISYFVKSLQPMEVAVGVYHTSETIITAVPQDTTGDIVIPSTVTAPDGNLYTVTSVGYQAFRGCANITSVSLPESITEISPQSFTMCVKLSTINIPNSVNSIGYNAFMNCNGLSSVTLPNSITSIGFGAFGWCPNLLEVYSYIEDPFAISSGGMGNAYNPFDYNREGLTLYVPAGTKAKYEATEGWKEFKNIVEMVNLEPIEGETTVNTESLSGQDLSDNVVGDVYFNTGDNSYDATDGSIIISEATNMGQITNAEPGSADVKDNFTGIILKVAKGKGVITVNVKTSGNAQLVVQVGDGTPMIASKSEKGDVVVSYDVEEDTYVYIYAILGSSTARATRASSDGEVRIYGISVRPGATGISSIVKEVNADTPIYNLSGQRLSVPRKGVNIINGRKVVIN